MKPFWIVAAACAVWASACSKSEPDAAPTTTSSATSSAPSPAAAAAKIAAQKALAQTYPRVEIATDAGLFWFEPRLCTVGLEPGQSEVSYSIQGAGQTPDGQPVYASISDEDYDPTTGPELRLNVGTDQPYKTTEVSWISGPYNARLPAAKTTVQGKTLEVQGAVFTRSGEERLTTQGPIRIDCTQRR